MQGGGVPTEESGGEPRSAWSNHLNFQSQGEMPTYSESSVLKFHCGGCGQKLSVEAGYEGRKFSCPKCAVESHVPGSAPTDVWLNDESDIKFFCDHCKQRLSCEESGAGSEIECPLCGEATSVPARSLSGKGSDDPPPSDDVGSGRDGREGRAERGPDQQAVSESSWEKDLPAGKEPNPLNGNTEGLPPGEKTRSREDLIESLKGLGFEVESVPNPGKKDSDPADKG